MKSHSKQDFHDDFETREFRHRDRPRQRDYDRREAKRVNYEEEDGDDALPEFRPPPQPEHDNSI